MNKGITRFLSTLFVKTDNTVIQFGKYILLGNISNLADFGCLYILTAFVRLHYLISAGLSFMLGVSINYVISVLWIFKRGRLMIHQEFFYIFIISGIGLGLNEFIIFALVSYLSLHYMISKFVAATIIVFWNFYGRKKWIFVR